jgi:small-conductance mechanosensitive channel
MEFWQRLAVAGCVIALASVIAKFADRALSRRRLGPELTTKYRVLRRTVMTAIVAVGLLSALLVIPQVRAVAGGILASGAVLGLIVGFASQRTLGNAVAGILIAFTQPLRLGDHVTLGEGVTGVVEEIGLTYTWIRSVDASRFVVPNEMLASDTIHNFTIRSPEKVAEVTVHVPLAHDLDAVTAALAEETGAEVFVSALGNEATVTLRRPAASEPDARLLESDLRLGAHRALRAAGVFR